MSSSETAGRDEPKNAQGWCSPDRLRARWCFICELKAWAHRHLPEWRTLRVIRFEYRMDDHDIRRKVEVRRGVRGQAIGNESESV